jgi:hypothetical protein
MHMPGFTAAVALGRTAAHYRAVVASQAQAAGRVNAAYISSRTSCYLRCLADDPGDPYAVENCRCICYGHPGRTCVLQ